MTAPIDSHVHLYPPEVNRDPAGWAAANGEGRWAALCARRRRDGRPVQGFPDLAGLLRAMDAAGVERAVLQGWYWEHHAACVRHNRFYAECVRAHPDRLAGFATFHPAAGREATLAEVARARADGLRGLGELSPHSQGYPVDHPVFLEVLALAGEIRLPVVLHATDPDGRPYPGRVLTPGGDFLRLAQDHPAVTFVLAHWGGMLPLRTPAAAVPGNVRYDTAASPLMYDRSVWAKFAAATGAERVLFGSDFPLNLYPALEGEPEMERLLAEARGAGLAPAELAAVLRENAERMLPRNGPAARRPGSAG